MPTKKPQRNYGRRVVAGTTIHGCKGCPYYRWKPDNSESNHAGESMCGCESRSIAWDVKDPKIPKWCPLPKPKLKPRVKKYVAGTGLMGGTATGQRVATLADAEQLPPGTVIRLDSKGRLIHLHDGLWLYCCDNAWCYDKIRYLARYLPGTLCHMPVRGG
jgi:hypothetical protein